MPRPRRPALRPLLSGALWLALATAPALAQDGAAEPASEPPSPPVPSTGVPLSTGFTPDPLELAGQTRGAVPLSARAPGCRGYVGDAPDQVLRLESPFGFLRLFVTAPQDVTLAVRSPDGRWSCTGRPLLGAPREEGAFQPGVHEVWIGAVRPHEVVPYTLHVSEFRSASPRAGGLAVDGAGVDIGLSTHAPEGRFRGRRLRPGFLPDPRRDGGFAGGPRSASLLGAGCRGELHSLPGHLLELRNAFGYFRVHVREAEGPVSLVVRTPSGEVLCSAPDGGLPAIEQEAWPAGSYRIWVGSRTAGSEPRYRIEYTETRPAAD